MRYTIDMSSKILIIEDNHTLTESLCDILSLDDYEVTATSSGREGLEKALKLHPDLIILDIKMPDMDGYQVFAALRKDIWGKQARVLILTASESIEQISKNVDLPTKYVLFKPKVSVEQLREVIKARLSQPE